MLSNVRFQDVGKPHTFIVFDEFFLVNTENSIGLKNYTIYTIVKTVFGKGQFPPASCENFSRGKSGGFQ